MTDSNDNFTADELETYKHDTSSTLVREVFSIVNEHKEKYGENFALDLSMMITSSMIATIVMRSLVDKSQETGYAVIKQALELSIGNAFVAAAHAAGAKEGSIDFVCKVSEFSNEIETANKLPI